MGIKRIGTGIDSNGIVYIIPNKPRKINKYFNKRINQVKSRLAKCKNGSKKHKKLSGRKRKLYSKKNEKIKQTLHIESNKLTNMNYNTIVVGDLEVKKLMQKPDNKKKKVSRSFSNSNISMFLGFVKYKAKNKGINVVKVDEHNTTQLNCLTGKLFEKKIELSDRTVKLSEDIVIDRDLNSAINLYRRCYNHHLVALTPPLDLPDVLDRNNIQRGVENFSISRKQLGLGFQNPHQF